MSTVIGLTGPTGAGKSSLSAVAERLGFFYVDCDAVARRESRNPQMLSSLALCFGDDVVKGGVLDRAVLAKRAFSSPESTEKLNEITLPFIVAAITEMIKDETLVLLDAPTLFESGLDSRCDAVICVLAEKSIRKERILSRDGVTEDAADARLSAAKTDEFFISRCDEVIYNNKGEDEFIKKAEEVLQKYI